MASPLTMSILDCPIQFQAPHTLVIVLHNATLQEEVFRLVQPELMKYLRETLNNQQLSYVIEKSSLDEQPKKIYTDEEKFSYLAEKNPSLLLLQKELGLDFEK